MGRETRNSRRRQEGRKSRKVKKRKKSETKGFVNKEGKRVGRKQFLGKRRIRKYHVQVHTSSKESDQCIYLNY